MRAWPFVGRESELAAIHDAAENASGIVVAGPAGVGKSRLLAEVGSRIGSAGADVVWIRGVHAAGSVPLGPFLAMAGPQTEGNLASIVLRDVYRRADAGPGAVIVDDAQLLDDASAAVVHQLGSAGLVTLVVGLRSGEPTPGAIEALWKDEILPRLELAPLDRSATTLLIESAIGPTSDQTLEWLWDRSRGHPIYLREVLRGVERAGGLTDVDGLAVIDPHIRLPNRLADLINSHLDALGPRSLRVLAALSLTGPIVVSALREVGTSADLASLHERNLVDLSGDIVDVAHPLYGEAAVLLLDEEEADLLRVALAVPLAIDESSRARAAALLLDAGVTPDLELLKDALTQAVQLRQPMLAIQVGQALQSIEPSALVLSQLAGGRAMLQQWDSVDELFEQALDLAADTERATVWHQWIHATFEYRQDPGKANALAARALDELTGSDRNDATSMALRSRMFVEPLGPVHSALQKLSREPELSDRARARVALDVATSGWHLLELTDALRAADAVISDEDPDLVSQARARQVKCSLLGLVRGFSEAFRYADLSIEWATTLLDPDAVAVATGSRVWIAASGGDASQVLIQYDALVAVSRAASDRRAIALALAERALALSALVGREKEAEEALREIEAFPPGARILTGVLEALAQSRLARRGGDSEGGAALIDLGLERARWRNTRLQELLCLRDRVMWHGPNSVDVARISHIADIAQVGLAVIYRDDAVARLAADASALDTVAQQAHDYGASVTAWEAAGTAHHLHRESGHMLRALRSELRYESLSAKFAGQETPVRADISPILTKREREVAGSVCSGLTNAQAADELYLSPKTVKRHLERIYDKLGISDRQTLASVLAAPWAPVDSLV